MAGFENDIGFSKNFDFTQADNQAPTESNGLVTNGQLWIGSTATNAGGTHINVGNLTSPDSSITFGYSSPNITAIAGPTTATTYTADSGTATPSLNNLNVFTLGEAETSASGSTVNIFAPRVAEFIVDATLYNGTHQTIAAAITAASSGDTIFIRPGTYAENLTLKAGVNLTAFTCDAQRPNVTIQGKCTLTTGGVTCSGIRFLTNNDYALSVSGGNLKIVNCLIDCVNNTGIENTGGTVNLWYSLYDKASNSVLFSQSSGTFNVFYTYGLTSGSGTNTISGGSLALRFAQITETTTLSNDASTRIFYTRFPANTTALILSNTATANVYFTQMNVGGNAAVTVAAGTSAELYNCNIESSTTNVITGAGSVTWSGLTFSSTGSTITATTQVPQVFSNNRCKVTTPGAYAYTTVPQDYLILVDTSAARTINLNASPTTGQTYVIKDNVGSAAANNITVTPAAGNIDGAGSYSINVNYGSITVIYNGSSWSVT